jgi:hypothetical protein
MTSRTIMQWMLVTALLFSSLTFTSEVQAKPAIKIGDYIRFGKMYNAPILWRVIHLDASGDAVLFSDRILTLKAFDAKGTFHKNPTRRTKGSNFWLNANIRQWLNSSSANSGGARIDWLQNDPTKANMVNGDNAYVTEKGFLADGNFSAAERNLIKPTSYKVLLAKVDVALKDGGTETHMANNKLAQVLTNYDKAYYKNVTDRVFLLTAQQMKRFVYDRRTVLGANYHIAKPTSGAVKNSSYKNPLFLSANLPWYYWLNTPGASTPEDVRFVFSSGGIGSNVAALDNSGVRPALSLRLKDTTFATGGKGTAVNPYVVSGSKATSVDKLPPTAPGNLQVTGMSGNSLTVKWGAAKDNVGMKGYEVYANNKLIASTTNTVYTFKNLNSASPVDVKIRAVDSAGNKSVFSKSLSSGQTIQLIGNRVFLNFKKIEPAANGTSITRSGQIIVPARPILQTLGLKVQWNSNKNQLTAVKPGFNVSFTIGNKTAIVNSKVKKTMTIAPVQVNGNTMISLSFVATQLGYKLNIK